MLLDESSDDDDVEGAGDELLEDEEKDCRLVDITDDDSRLDDDIAALVDDRPDGDDVVNDAQELVG
jgi:hypothetical protein